MTKAHPATSPDSLECWPAFRLAEWKETYATLHMWTQIVGKVRLALTPRVNHWWNVPLYVYSRGLTTSAKHYEERVFELRFDFLNHQLLRLSERSDLSSPVKEDIRAFRAVHFVSVKLH